MKVIATDIANLTDARYFAAWGVEGMAYSIDPAANGALTGKKLKEIVDWVEGPATMLKMEGLELPENLAEIQSLISVDEVIIGPFIERTFLSDFKKVYRICTLEDDTHDEQALILTFPHPIRKVTEAQRHMMKVLTANKEVYLDAVFKADDLDQIKALGFAGIIVKGGEEEKVGYKSYEELDEILEAIYY